jgi:superfamily II DNA or RNA helicase
LNSTKKIELWKHQTAAKKSMTDYFLTGRKKRGCVVLPTGSGKTVTAWAFLKERVDKGESVLWVVHREYLIKQAIDGMHKLGVTQEHGLWTAKEKDSSKPITFAMILSTRKLSGHFDWVVFDEAHRAAAQSYLNLEDRITYKKKLGLTATPERLDQKELELGDIIYQISFRELVNRGILAKPQITIIHTGESPTVEMSGGDIAKRSLQLFNTTDRNELIARAINEHPEWGKTLVFACDIEHVEALSSKTDDSRHPAIIHSKLSRTERDENLRAFSSGDVQTLFNCEVFTEGYDEPTIQTIIMARPTVSKSLWVQMVGRGARVLPDKRTFNLIILLDDVGKYEYLVNEWVMENIPEEDLTGDLAFMTKAGRAKKGLQKLGAPIPADMSYLSTIIAILRVAKNFPGNPYGYHPLDLDRLKCLHLLDEHFKGTPWAEVNRGDIVDGSYGYCVPSGEFTIYEWRAIAWAYYYHKIKKQKENPEHKPFWSLMYLDHDKCKISDAPTQYKEAIRRNIDFNDRVATQITMNHDSYLKAISKTIGENEPRTASFSHSVTSFQITNRVAFMNTRLQSAQGGVQRYISLVAQQVRKDLEDDHIPVILRIKR